MNSKNDQNFNRSDIKLALSKEFPDLSKSQISLAIDSILEIIIDAVALDDRVEIRGFGSFSLHYRVPRIGRNPKTGTPVALSGKYVPHFKPGKELRDRVNDSMLAEQQVL